MEPRISDLLTMLFWYPVKYLILFVFLLNYKSWPLFWHGERDLRR